MSDPSLVLQGAIVAALKDDAGVAAVVGERVYDDPPTASPVAFPYIDLGQFQVLDDWAGCIEGSEINFDVHVWSRSKGTPEAKAIVGAVRGALNDVDLDLSPAHRLIEITFQTHRIFTDADGATTHGVVTFRALTETAV